MTKVNNGKLGELEYGSEYERTEDVWTVNGEEVADDRQDIIFVAAKSTKSEDEQAGTYTW